MRGSDIVTTNNLAKVKAIEAKHKKRLLELNPKLNDKSGIYFWTRTDENGIRHAYVGLAKSVLHRNIQHMMNWQYIDNSIRKHGLYDEEKNPYGYKLNFLNFPESQLEEMERYYITLYAQNGFQMKNRDTGGGKGKTELGERKNSKGYYDGIAQGKKNLARELSNIIDKHLVVSLKPGKQNNKISIRAFEKFNDLLKEE